VDGTCTGAQNTYTYQGRDAGDTADVAADPPFYKVSFCLGAGTGGYAAGVHNASPSGIN
jgi:hypothetical protein